MILVHNKPGPERSFGYAQNDRVEVRDDNPAPFSKTDVIMKKILTLLLPLLALAGCYKETPGQVGHGTELPQEEHTVTLRIGSRSRVTKAYDIGDAPLNDGIRRLDVYVYDLSATGGEPRHIVMTPDESGVTTLELKEKKDQQLGVMVIGNLDPDSAAYYNGKTLSNLGTAGRIYLSAGNFAPDAIPMIASSRLTFNQDQTVELPLLRILCRIDVNNLKVDFDDANLLGKEVWIKNIIIGNANNVFCFMPGGSFSSGIYTTHFGADTCRLADNALGGIRTGFRYRTNAYSPTISGSGYYSGSGKMNGTLYNAYNVCFERYKGALTMDAPGTMREATVQHYDKSAGSGKIVSAGDMTTPHTFKVGKSFYAIYHSLANPGDINSDYSSQIATQKLIFEIEIDGKSWFYPIELTDTQPNTVYQIENITLKSLGSEYANFYVKKHTAAMSVSVKNWDEAPIANWNLGVDPDTGEPLPQD